MFLSTFLTLLLAFGGSASAVSTAAPPEGAQTNGGNWGGGHTFGGGGWGGGHTW